MDRLEGQSRGRCGPGDRRQGPEDVQPLPQREPSAEVQGSCRHRGRFDGGDDTAVPDEPAVVADRVTCHACGGEQRAGVPAELADEFGEARQ